MFSGKRRRQEANFPGAKVILEQLREKPPRKRVGIVSSGAPARGRLLTTKRPLAIVIVIINICIL